MTTTTTKRTCECVEDVSQDPRRVKMQAYPECEVCDGTGEISERAIRALDQAAATIDEMRGDIKGLDADAEKILAAAWWQLEDRIRDLSGRCSMGSDCKEAAGGYCSVCREYKSLTNKSRSVLKVAR